MHKPTFKTLNQIMEGYYHPGSGLSEVTKFIVEHQNESLFILDYKGILYQKILLKNMHKDMKPYYYLIQKYIQTLNKTYYSC